MKTTISFNSTPLRIIDVTVQSILLLTAVVGLFGELALVLYAQLFIGIWQMTGLVFSITRRRPHYKIKRWLLFIATIYLLVLMSGKIHSLWLWTLPAWILALFYYTITWLTMIPSKKRSSFLPNLSF